jgi:hypothetical protein
MFCYFRVTDTDKVSFNPSYMYCLSCHYEENYVSHFLVDTIFHMFCDAVSGFGRHSYLKLFNKNTVCILDFKLSLCSA